VNEPLLIPKPLGVIKKMNKRIAILRGINVGGKMKILMTDLKSVFENMKFSNVKTYIQSGNVFFEVKKDIGNSEVAKKIEEAIENKFGFDVPVIVKTPQEIEMAINRNPFYKDGVDILHLHVTFINEETKKENQQKTESCYYEPDKFERKRCIHLLRGKISPIQIDKQFF
jgi:uncharacterized protein (DUF1697 family)